LISRCIEIRLTCARGVPTVSLEDSHFAHTQKTTDQTDVILTLTPHIIRVLDLTEADLRPFRVGRDSLAPITELPLPVLEPPKPDEPAAPKKPGGGGGRR
jgi:hypothetical protein